MAVCLSAVLLDLRRRFWCTFESAALHAHSVAIASSHYMHKQFYSSASPAAAASGGRICSLEAILATAAGETSALAGGGAAAAEDCQKGLGTSAGTRNFEDAVIE